MQAKEFERYCYQFVAWLQSLAESEEGEAKAALADLRRGWDELPHRSARQYRHIQRRLPERLSSPQEESCFLVATLFADYHTGRMRSPGKATGNMGDHFAAARDPQTAAEDEAVERRFNTLLTAHPDDLTYHLRQATSYLRSRGESSISINWAQLMNDVALWASDDRRPDVQKRWARAFWRSTKPAHSANPVNSTSQTVVSQTVI